MSDMKEVEMQHDVGEINFTALLGLSELLKHSTNLGLEADPTALPSHSSAAKMKHNLIMLHHEKPSPEEKKIALPQSSVRSFV